MMLDGFMEVVIDFRHALLAFVIGAHDRNGSGKCKEAR
jgi:hypothetical protein